MDPERKYSINLDAKFAPLQMIDLPSFVSQVTGDWVNQTLCRVNDCVVRLGVFEGEFHWHKHDAEDEFFLVLQGRLLIDLEGKTVSLEPQQGFTVPRGALHRTRAPERTAILMVEKASVKPAGD